MFSLIVAITKNGGIGKNNTIPWKIIHDLKHFKSETTNGMIIMGRKTWESIQKNPLPNRINVVISRSLKDKSCYVFNSIFKFLEWIPNDYKMEKYVIGGVSIYNQFLNMGLISRCIITNIDKTYDCDSFFNKKHLINIYSSPKIIKSKFEENYINGIIEIYYLSNIEENNFLYLIRKIKNIGNYHIDRTNIGTKSIFGAELTFSLRDNKFPLLTTRKLPLRHIFEELMWILRGQTNNRILKDKKINIWTPNSTREFLDQQGLTDLKEGDIGASYGHQMRHFGALYNGCDYDYSNKGFDQLKYVINLLKTRPFDRRIIISLWDPNSLHRMSLPACMYNYQFYVSDGYLSCKATQRSSDIMLAGGWNIAFASLFTILLADVCNLKPDKLIWSVGDVHIYNNQLEIVDELLSRKPKQFPILFVKNHHSNITDFEFDDIKLIGYFPYPNIKINFNA